MKPSKIESAIRVARRRLVSQAILNRTVAWVALGMGLALVWFLIQPFLFESPPAWLRWAVLGLSAGLAGIASIVWSVKQAPSPESVALEIDTRCSLRERVTTVVGLPQELRETPAGQALLADAEEKIAPIALAEKFPIQPRKSIWALPALALSLGLVAWLYNPALLASSNPGEGENSSKLKDSAALKQEALKKKTNPLVKPPGLNQQERERKSPELKELEDKLRELDQKYTKDPNADTPEKAREKLTDLQPLEEQLKKFADEQAQQLKQLQDKLEKLDGLNKDKDFGDGPAKQLNDALSKGDLKKAQDEVDELRKKAKDKKLDKQDQEKLNRQLDKMKSDLERLARDKEREKDLQKKIDQAKQEGKDAESLERELEKTKAENEKSSEQLEKLAQKLGNAQQALEQQDLEKLEEELAGAKDELGKIEDQVEDFKDAEATLQRLKEERKAACKACQGQGEGKKDGDPRVGKSGPNNGGIGAGEREINEKAETSKGDEERIRGLFDGQGKKNYGGLVKGQAFKKTAETELGQEIKQAIQQAPSAPDAQRFSRETRDSVKEYFERLGNTGSK